MLVSGLLFFTYGKFRWNSFGLKYAQKKNSFELVKLSPPHLCYSFLQSDKLSPMKLSPSYLCFIFLFVGDLIITYTKAKIKYKSIYNL